MTTETTTPPGNAAREGPARPATLEDLARHGDVKAELIAGRIVEYPMSGQRPVKIAAKIYASLLAFVASVLKVGEAHTDGLDYTVGRMASGRESFRPDASYHAGPFPSDAMDFVPAAPTFAVEVRSKHDYGPAAEREMAAKRADYLEAGTVAVWDVDTLGEIVRLYTRQGGAHEAAAVFARGQTAHAEPAVPGWVMAADEIFAP